MSNEITNSLQPIPLEQSTEDEIETKIKKIPHYAHHISKEKYRDKVKTIW